MASSLRVNSIIPSSGTNVAIGTAGGTISYNASVSGVSTFSSGIIIGTGASISSPETNVLALGTNNTEKVRVGSAGSVGIKTSNPQIDLQISQSGGIQAVNTSEIALRYNVYYDGSVDRYIQSSNKAASLVLNSLGEFLFYNTDTASSSTNSTISGWASRAKIDSSGRLSLPYQPAFRAYYSSRSSVIGSGTFVFDQVDNNIGSHYNTSNGRFTAPIAGYYHFSASIQHSGGTSTAGWADIRKNGAAIFVRNEHAFGAVFSSIGSAVSVYLSASDYVEIIGSANVFWSDNSSFSGHFLG